MKPKISAGLKEEANIDTRIDVQVEHFEANGRATSLLASQAKRGNQGKSAQSPAVAIVSEHRGCVLNIIHMLMKCTATSLVRRAFNIIALNL